MTDAGCEAGFATCGGGSACATNLSSDSANCGACNHSCKGGACFSGVCQPFAIASGLDAPQASEIAIDDTYVYFSAALLNGVTTSTLYRVAKAAADASGSSTPLFVGPASQSVRGVALRATDVFWTVNGISANTGKVQFVPRAGGAAMDFATGESSPYGLATDNVAVYWLATGGTPAVRKKPINGSATTIVGSIANPTRIATNGASVYYAANGIVSMASVVGANPTVIAGTGGNIISKIFLTSTAMYWSNYYNTNEILTATLAGTNAKTLYTGASAAMSVAVDADNAYAVFQGTPPAQFKDGVLVKIPLNGMDKPAVIATISFPQAVAVDADSIYVTGSSYNVAKTGTLWRVAK